LRDGVDFGAARAKRADDVGVAAEGGKMEAGIVLVPAAPQTISASGKQTPYNDRMPVLCGYKQRGTTIECGSFNIKQCPSFLSQIHHHHHIFISIAARFELSNCLQFRI
jgi:hypothetical protein